MKLTALAVKNAKGREKAYKLTDGAGMYLLVNPNGRKYWRLNYRFGGKRKTLAIGVYPTVSLAEAREKREAAKKLLAENRDPAIQRRIQRLTAGFAAGTTFKEIAEEWLAKLEREGRADSTMSKLEWLLSFAYPIIGDRPINEITAPELLAALRTFEIRGRYESARRLRGTCGQVFRYAIATGRAERDISVDLRGALTTPRVTHRPAIVEPKAFGELLRALESYKGQPTVLTALRLAPHVFVRPGELRQAEWDEFDFDAAIWMIPDFKTKMRRPHKVPLSRQSIAILDTLYEITGHRQYVFPSLINWKRPMSENSVNAALRRLGYSKDEMTCHGFRATASTLLNEMGDWHADAIERQLGHVESNDVRRAYARGEHWDERVKMMQAWSDYIDHLRDGGKVIVGRFGKRPR